jgi:hypothetical protein
VLAEEVLKLEETHHAGNTTHGWAGAWVEAPNLPPFDFLDLPVPSRRADSAAPAAAPPSREIRHGVNLGRGLVLTLSRRCDRNGIPLLVPTARPVRGLSATEADRV